MSVNDELSKMRKESVVAYFNVIGGFDKVILNISLDCRYKLHGLGIENITFRMLITSRRPVAKIKDKFILESEH